MSSDKHMVGMAKQHGDHRSWPAFIVECVYPRKRWAFSEAPCSREIGLRPNIFSTSTVVAASRPSRIARHNAAWAGVSSGDPLVTE
jgi:hypothetical protein